MRKVVIASACRTAIGKMGGALANTPAVDLGTIARLDSASRSRRAEGSCPAAEREADEAQTARGLLGACVGRYRELGQAAGELAGQVTGLQDHVVVVQPEAAQLLTKDE